jgi:hypothetical protein
MSNSMGFVISAEIVERSGGVGASVDPFNPNDKLYVGWHAGKVSDIIPSLDVAYVVSTDGLVRAPFRMSKSRVPSDKLSEGLSVRFEIDQLGNVVNIQPA